MGDVAAYVIREFDAQRQKELVGLFHDAWWTAKRDRAAVEHMIAGSDVLVGLVEPGSDRLVGFARAISDGVFLAVVLDVIVDAAFRGTGLGSLLMDELLATPALSGVDSIELVCQPELVRFYRRWGFTDQVGDSLLMRRTANPLLAGQQAQTSSGPS